MKHRATLTIMHNITVMSSRTLVLMPFLLLVALLASTAAQNPTGCLASCGGGSVKIEYPFGIGATGCFRPGFEIKCNGSTPVLPNTTTEVPLNDLDITSAQASVMLPIGWQCYNSTSDKPYDWSYGDVEFNRHGVHRISNTHNQLVVIGCNTVGYTTNQRSEGNGLYSYAFATGCMSYCNNSKSAENGACAGVGCCQVDIPPGITDNYMNFRTYTHEGMMDFSPCDYVFFVDRKNFTFDTADLKMDRNGKKPVWLDWAIRDHLTCEEAQKASDTYACVSPNSVCRNSTNGPGYFCSCSNGYRGNPYLRGKGKECEDIDECKEGDPCRGNYCKNTPGFYECSCPRGSYSADPFTQPCYHAFPLAAKILIGAAGGFLIVSVMVLVRLLGKEKRKLKKERKMAKEFFEKNGGPILEKVNKIKLFKKEELNSILKNRHSLGEGGFGEVYKGDLLGDDSQPKPVAVKRPKKVNLADHQFANEVIIQSRVLHKNIVKLIGCCLEVDVPFLVYEFVTKGSLDDILHGRNKMSLNFIQRLQIAAQSAKGLAYLHSEIAEPIQHGDIKPGNILLNDDLMPKISDFGISKLITKDKKYATTVIGDVSYVDPIYLQTGKLTNKSDVYSFGVVLLELITRKSASDPGNGNLIGNFHDAYINKREIEIVDPEIAVEENIQLLHRLFEMIKQCLDLDVDQRPEMTVVEDYLRDMLKAAQATKTV